MPAPPKPILQAAVRWLDVLRNSDHNVARTLFVTAERYADLTPTQYDVAYIWLKSVGLLDDADVSTPIADQVFDAAILHSDALWLADADSLIQAPEELPADVHAVAEALGIEDISAFQRVHQVWGKVDLVERKRIGDAGEFALIGLLSEAAASHDIDHVALRADGFGYDIAYRRCGEARNFEVKTTTRRTRTVLYLSRHEYRTMMNDPNWHLVVVRLDGDLEPIEVGRVPQDWISSNVPVDTSTNGRWESCRMTVPEDVLVPGVPVEIERPDGVAGRLLSGW
ncbi:protein NO VEIN domain-containing protein [Nocardia sp. NPDC058518]|uniref:protein NO VEIN domain-containing protein n=1 Tax=Nocardia sp. NPDC058518 TaxID=3346534 RepID=UPI00365DA567